MSDIICTSGHVISPGRNTCERCNATPLLELKEIIKMEDSNVPVDETVATPVVGDEVLETVPEAPVEEVSTPMSSADVDEGSVVG